MRCDGQFGEEYALFVLGALEPPERQEILSHLESSCETCGTELRANLNFWSVYSAAFVTSDLAPPARLRQRILDAISDSRWVSIGRSRWRFVSVSVWRQPIAALLLLTAGGGLGWLGSRYLSSPATTRPIVTNITSTAEIQHLQAQVEELRNNLASASARLEAAAKAPLAGVRQSEVEKVALGAAQSELAQTKAQFTEASNKLRQVQQELTQNQTLLASAQKERQAAEDQLRTAMDDRAKLMAERDRLTDLERRLTAENRQLQQQVISYQAVVEKQSRNAAPLLRLAGMLDTPSLRFLRLKGTGGHGEITGSAFISEGSGVLIYASGLPPPPSGRTYQLWLMRRQSPGIVSGGIFKPDQNGRAFIEVEPSQLTRGVNTVAVTDEPEGGSPGPTGAKFLIGVQS